MSVVLYTLEQGPTEKMVIEQCMASGRKLPGSIATAPQLILGLELYYLAYLDLQSCRPTGLDAGRISWLSVYDYSQRNGLTDEQHDDLQYFVVQLDEAYLTWNKDRVKSARKSPASKQQSEN